MALSASQTPVPRLLVASIYAPSPHNVHWRVLQERFLQETAAGLALDFRYYLNGVDTTDLGGGDIRTLGHSETNAGHPAALRAVLSELRRHEYDYYLILDSDCFPVRPGWLSILVEQMARFGKRFAAPIRTENLDLFPHPCAFLITGAAIHDPRLNFDSGHSHPNLLHQPVADVGNAMLPLLPEILPLMRTNVRNRHPVAAAIYHHLFYHHGSGSRRFGCRLTNVYAYSAHWWDRSLDADLAATLMNELVADPTQYLAALMRIDQDRRHR